MPTSTPPSDPAHRAADHSQQQRRFETQVAREKTLLNDSDPYADHDRQAEPENQIDFLPECTLFPVEQELEFLRSHQRARHNRGHAQLEQLMDKDEPGFH